MDRIVEYLRPWMKRDVLIRSLGTSALLYICYRAIRFIRWYRRWFKFYNERCQGVADFSVRSGNLHLYPFEFERRAEVEKAWMKRFPKYYRIWLGPAIPLIRIYHPDTIRNLVKSTAPKARGFGAPYRTLEPWLGEGLLLSGGQRWARARRLLTPAFHFEILKPYVTITNEAIDRMFEKIDKHVAAGTSFELFNMISLCTFDILLRCAMSVEEDIQTEGYDHPYVNAINEIVRFVAKRNLTPVMHVDCIYYNTSAGRRFQKMCDYVHSWAEDIIDKRRQTLEKEGPPKSRYLDFLDILLSARDAEGKGLTPLEIRNEVDTFLFEGFDTTTSGISWSLHTMSKRQAIQGQVQEELDNVLKGRSSKHINWDDLTKLEYLTRCIKEAMRVHSPVPYINRIIEQDMELDGKIFPAGTNFSISIWNLHHNEAVWENPDVYDPDRFLPENIQQKDSYAYIPFSAGPRNCIGQHFALNEEKVIIGRVLERYQLIEDQSHPVERMSVGVMKSVDGLWTYAKHRH